MTLNLQNNRTLNLDEIRAVQVRKSLAFAPNGTFRVWGWNVIACFAGADRMTIASYGPDEERQAFAFCSMINHMTIFTNQN